MSQFSRLVKFLFSMACVCFCCHISDVSAAKAPPIGSVACAKTSLQRHFDLNKDQYLSRYEYELMRTHLIRKFPLAIKISEKAYDFDQNAMLEPYEAGLFKKEKGTTAFKNRIKEFKLRLREEKKHSKDTGVMTVPGNSVLPGYRPRF